MRLVLSGAQVKQGRDGVSIQYTWTTALYAAIEPVASSGFRVVASLWRSVFETYQFLSLALCFTHFLK